MTPKVRVLSVQTTLLGNRTYGELLRRAFADSEAIAFEAHWSTEVHDAGIGPFERQLDRVFLKMIEKPAIRRRNLDFFPFRYELGTSYWARRTLNRRLRDARPDVLHVHSQALAWLSLDVMAKIPTVLSADGTSYQMAEQQLEGPWRWTFAGNHLFERTALRRAAAVVVFSQWAADSMIADHGLDPGHVRVIPPGVDVGRFGAFAARPAGPGVPFRILFVGGEFERKGGPDLVAAFLASFGEDENVELHVVTQSAWPSPHPRIFTYRGVEAYSEAWHGHYRSADLFVMPTKRDQSPIVFLEAMAAGVPVITTPVGSAAEAVVDGVTGYIVPSGDGYALRDRMLRLRRDPELRARFAAASRTRVEERFDARANAMRLERLLLDVAARARA